MSAEIEISFHSERLPNVTNVPKNTFCFGVSSNLSQQKSQTAEILGKYFLQTIVPRKWKYMRKISAVGLFCCDKFEETPKQKVKVLKILL